MYISTEELQMFLAGDNATTARLFPVFRTCAEKGAKQAGHVGLTNETLSALYESFMEKGLGERFDVSKELEPFLIESARRITLDLAKYQYRHYTGSQADFEGASDEFIEKAYVAQQQMSDALEDSVEIIEDDRAKLLKRIKERANMEEIYRIMGEVKRRSEAKRAYKTNEKKRRNSHDRQEAANILREIRKQIALTQTEMAVKLNCKYGTYVAYENARLTVPDDLLKKARALAKTAKKNLSSNMHQGKTMQAIIHEWCDLLGIQRSMGVRELARLLSVDPSTLSRWYRNISRPTASRIARMDKEVRILASKVKLIQAASTE